MENLVKFWFHFKKLPVKLRIYPEIYMNEFLKN